MSKLLSGERTLARSLTGRDSDSDDDYPSHKSSAGRQNASRGLPLVILIVSITLLIFWGWPFVVVPAGHSAVVDLFGYVQKDTIPAGFRLKQLFSNTYLFSLKTQLVEVTQDTPTSEGLMIELDVSILYHLEPASVVKLYTEIGTNYNEVLVSPEIESSIRGLTSKFTAKTLYSAGREELSQGINDELNEKLKPRGITVEQVLLRKVVLPELVTTAIEEKLQAEQASEKMEFVLAKEKSEAERKRIEAKGIADFQRIVSKGINGHTLEWKGIEATEKLAKSDNNKVVVIGSLNGGGLPFILGDDRAQ